MYTPAEIIEKLRKGIEICYEENKNQVTKENMRLVLKTEKVLFTTATKVSLLDAAQNKELRDVKVNELFGINLAEGLAVNNYLTNKLRFFADQEKIKEHEISAHIYTIAPNFYPSLRILKNGEILREVQIEELTN